jgi:hypothetical protein
MSIPHPRSALDSIHATFLISIERRTTRTYRRGHRRETAGIPDCDCAAVTRTFLGAPLPRIVASRGLTGLADSLPPPNKQLRRPASLNIRQRINLFKSYILVVKITLARWVLLGIVVSSRLFGGDVTFNVALQTSPSFLTTPAYLDFQFTQGDPAEVGSNTAQVSLSNLFPDFILSDGSVPGSGEHIIPFSPGGPIGFAVRISSNVTSATTPDLFAIYILDSSFNAINTTDPAGVGTLISFTEPTDPTQEISLGLYDTANNDFNTSVTLAPAPEPSTLLLSACLLIAVFSRCLRKRSSEPKVQFLRSLS